MHTNFDEVASLVLEIIVYIHVHQFGGCGPSGFEDTVTFVFVCLLLSLFLFTFVFVYFCLCLLLSLFTLVFVYFCLCLLLSLFTFVHGHKKI